VKLKRWWAETHGSTFELVRHFLGRFFDSDLVTEPGQWTRVLVTGFALLLPAFFLIAQVLLHKYAYFSRLSSPEPYRQAVRADELWLITLTMSVVGLFTAVQWQALFPGKRDYMALGNLPVRPRQIFMAKFVALFAIVSALVAVLNAVPSILFPVVSFGRWQTSPSFWIHVATHATTCILGCYFIFFSLLGIQGILLNLFRPAWFSRMTSYLQGAAITLMLAGIVLSFSIGPSAERTLLRPGVAKWLPPVWWLGFYQWILGDQDPIFRKLAAQAALAFGAAVIVALASYLISYRRHRELAMEGLPASEAPGRLAGRLLDLLVRNPRQQAVLAFMIKTIARSSQHRIVMVGYFGFSLAIVLTGIAGMAAVMKPDWVVLASFTYAHLVLLVFAAAGLRQVFGIPMELRANWTFQVTEREGRGEWLRAVDGIATLPVILIVIALPAPFEIALLGWRGAGEIVLLTVTYLLLYESLFYHWQKLPFTCSYVPGQGNGFVVVFRFFGVLALIPVVNLIFVKCIYSPGHYIAVCLALFIAWIAVRNSRRVPWSYTPLRFIEEPEPAVRSLNLGTI
jgi:hypothetical protein